jgi:hypothetical protein
MEVGLKKYTKCGKQGVSFKYETKWDHVKKRRGKLNTFMYWNKGANKRRNWSDTDGRYIANEKRTKLKNA